MGCKKLQKRRGRIWILLLISLIFLSGFIFPEERKTKNLGYSIKLTFGKRNVPIGDVNRALESFNNNDLFEWSRVYTPDQISGEIKTLNHDCLDWEVELRKHISPNLSLSFATSLVPVFIKNESSLTYIYRGSVGDQTSAFTFKPKIAWIPLKFGLCYSLIRFSGIELILSAGIGYHITKVSQSKELHETYPLGGSEWVIWHWKAHNAGGFSFHTGISLELSITKKFAIVAEAQVRQAKMKNLKGKEWKESKNFGIHGEDKGTLYYFNKWDIGIGTRYDDLTVWKEPPFASIYSITDVRKAVLDLNGYSVRAGIRIKLF